MIRAIETLSAARPRIEPSNNVSFRATTLAIDTITANTPPLCTSTPERKFVLPLMCGR